eukprot:TRINITY_DN5140_c0_g1_i2.p1 TRINITY_DN5140_c0_g1~~TRINITY_DN5140_c0_g1_i2.p1  ORF type:complete len:132 (+),score=16.10 TRINITY_DN5140_c0_g1_i2:41-436(+)
MCIRDRPSSLQWYESLHIYAGNYYSLAKDSDDLDALKLVQWKLSEPQGKVVADLGNSHDTPYFGPVSVYLDSAHGVYYALVVSNGPTTEWDRWSILSVDLHTFKVTLAGLSPWMIAETDSASGLGVPAAQK